MDPNNPIPSVQTPTPVTAPIQTPTVQQPSAPQSTVPPTRQEIPEVKGKLPFILIALFFLIGTTILGFWAYQKYSQAVKSIPETPEQTPLPTATENPTENWKTYTFGRITLKYPESFRYKESKGTEGCFTLEPNVPDRGKVLSRLTIKPPEGALGGCVLTGAADGKVESSEKNIFLNDKSYPFEITKFLLPDQTSLNAKLSDIPSKGYIIEYGGIYTKAQEQEYLSQEEIILQILSTFKFLDQTEKETTDWNVYSNSKLNFSFKYPKDWTTKPLSISTSFPLYGLTEISPINNTGPGGFIHVSYWDNPNRLTLQEMDDKYKGDIYFPGGSSTTINGLNAYIGKGVSCEPLMCDRIAILYGVYIVELKSTYNQTNTNKEIFDQILSTIKFSE